MIDGDKVAHSYTPVSVDERKGECQFIIKIYRPTEKFPKGGKLT